MASDSEPTTSSAAFALEGWTKAEKFELLQAIKEHGSKDVSLISSVIETKTSEEIERALNHYKGLAFPVNPVFGKNMRNRRDVNTFPTVPLAGWAKILSDTFTFEELQTETATALRAIAECETIPPPMCTDNIDFKQIYKQLANALEGKSIEGNILVEVLDKCITDTALKSKCFMRNSTLKMLLDEVNFHDKEMKHIARPTNNVELGLIREFVSQRNYNPLDIREEYLQ